MKRIALSNIVRIVVAVVLLVGLVVFVGRQIVPDVPAGTMAAYVLVAAGAAFVVLLVIAVASLQFRQFVLREGGTDAQWFWFASEPAGLVELRDEARAASSAEPGDKTT